MTGIAHSEVINYEWRGGNGVWSTPSNWAPAPGEGEIIGSTLTTDRVTIDGNVVVTHSGNIGFYGVGSGGLKAGTFDAITLKNGATLSITGNLRVFSAAQSGDTATRNVLLEKGTSLIVSGSINTGVQNSSNICSTWTVRGAVEASEFLGQQSTSTGSSNGGFILNIEGGSFTIGNSFNFKNSVSTLDNLIGRINLSRSGTFTVGGDILNWTNSSENYVNFVDGSGIFTFSHANWQTQADVESLINQGFIRKGSAVTGDFVIVNTGSSWQVSIDAIPEPSAFALLGLSAGAMFLFRKEMAGK